MHRLARDVDDSLTELEYDRDCLDETLSNIYHLHGCAGKEYVCILGVVRYHRWVILCPECRKPQPCPTVQLVERVDSCRK